MRQRAVSRSTSCGFADSNNLNCNSIRVSGRAPVSPRSSGVRRASRSTPRAAQRSRPDGFTSTAWCRGSSANLDSPSTCERRDVIALTQSDITLAGSSRSMSTRQGTWAIRASRDLSEPRSWSTMAPLTPSCTATWNMAIRNAGRGVLRPCRAGRQPFRLPKARSRSTSRSSLTGRGSRRTANRADRHADSLPFDMVPQLNDYVSNVRGQASGNFRSPERSTAPVLSGHFALHADQHDHPGRRST